MNTTPDPSSLQKTQLSKELVTMLCGGALPKSPDGFDWRRVDHFEPFGTGLLQAYQGIYPVGPILVFQAEALDAKQVLHHLQVQASALKVNLTGRN
jgi:hypothetical protein